MTHEHLPWTYAIDRGALVPTSDPDALGRLAAHVGDEFRGIGVLAVLGAISS